MVNKKIVGIVVCVALLSTLLPVTGTENPSLSTAEASSDQQMGGMLFAHVVAKGTGSYTSIGGSFFLGFGACWAMIITLEEDGTIEITSLTEPSNNVTLDGCHRIYIMGFMGLRLSRPQINVNGLAVFALWT
jgi:hypothetical protein